MPLSVFGANYFATQYASLDLWLAFCSVTPSSGDDGSTIMEVSEPDYVRLYLDPAEWSVVNNGMSYYALTLSTVPASYWGSINSWALLDTDVLGTGNVYSYGNISPQIYAEEGSYIELPPGSITIGVEV